MDAALHPSLHQINTRVWLTELARELGRPATLDDVPDAELDKLAAMGFDWIWLLSVWQTGEAGRAMSRRNPDWRREFRETLPNLCEDDIAGSGFAITGYTVHEALGGDAALARLRERLRQRGLRLMLDFVPNHTGLDHPWVREHPEYYVGGTEQDVVRSPQNYLRLKHGFDERCPRIDSLVDPLNRSSRREEALSSSAENRMSLLTSAATRFTDRIFAHGRDPYFPGWPDTLQLNHGNPATQEAMIAELVKIAGQCDGVRCDMAMLILPEVFEQTWGIRAQPFWLEAIRRAREQAPDFCFMAEVYWDLEWTLQQQGFDYTYDKRLYDRLREGRAPPVRAHFLAGIDFQSRLARFLENHDESRAAATFPPQMHEAAAVITYLSPGLRFFHQGQLEGRLKRISAHLIRAPEEAANSAMNEFYERLLAVLRRPIVRRAEWQLLECVPGWDGNRSCDDFIAFAWQDSTGARLLVAVNYASHSSQCFVRIPFSDLNGRSWLLRDVLGDAQHERNGNDLQSRGLFLDVPPWQYHAFEMTSRQPAMIHQTPQNP